MQAFRLALLVLLLAACLHTLQAAPPQQSFLYVGSPQYPCVSGLPCAPTELLVIDARTLGIVTRIPLPGTSVPSLAISPNGKELYVGGGGVVDLTTHTLVSTAGPGDYRTNRVAVRADGRTAFYLARSFALVVVKTLDTGTRTLGEQFCAPTCGNQPQDLAANPTRDVIYVNPDQVSEIDATTHTELSRFGASPVAALASDGLRVYAAGPTGVTVFDATTKAVLGTLNEIAATRIGTGSRRKRIFTIAGQETAGGRLRVFDAATLNPSPTVEVSMTSPVNVVASEDESRAFVVTAVAQSLPAPGGTSRTGFTNRLQAVDASTGSIVRVVTLPDSYRQLVFGNSNSPDPDGVTALGVTPDGAPRCSYQVGTAQSVWTVAGGTSSIALTTGCAWMASSDASWVRISQTSGTTSANLTVTVDPAATGAPRTATLTIAGQFVTISQAGYASTPPFGSFDTPQEGVGGISGSLAVTGWALDDTGVTAVRIFRDPFGAEPQNGPIFLGNATFVEGARPDVAAAFPTTPFNTRAGWGLNVLTNLLASQGNGTFRLYAYLDDVDGHTTVLGPRTFTSGNTMAAVPFGAIDTPGQGEVVFGTITCFGWALAPQPYIIPLDGSTIDVVIDGLVVGHPVYNNPRSDIAAFFPGYQNTSGPVGYFTIDTTQYTNGVHTLSWVVRDGSGNAAGIGSRYFTIQNP